MTEPAAEAVAEVKEATVEDATTMETQAPEAEVPETEYLVRLLFRIPAESPEQAVEKYLEQIMMHGLRGWQYRVEDEETGEMWHVNGYGEMQDSTVRPDDGSGD